VFNRLGKLVSKSETEKSFDDEEEDEEEQNKEDFE
jgi:hypothetical protein